MFCNLKNQHHQQKTNKNTQGLIILNRNGYRTCNRSKAQVSSDPWLITEPKDSMYSTKSKQAQAYLTYLCFRPYDPTTLLVCYHTSNKDCFSQKKNFLNPLNFKMTQLLTICKRDGCLFIGFCIQDSFENFRDFFFVNPLDKPFKIQI